MTSACVRQATPLDRGTEKIRIHQPDDVSHFVKDMTWLRRIPNRQMPAEFKDVFTEIIDLERQHGAAITHMEQLGDGVGLERRQVSKALKWLESRGWIREARDGYHADIPKAFTDSKTMSQIRHDACHKRDISVSHMRHDLCHERDMHPYREKSSKREKKREDFRPSVSTDGRTDDSSFSSDSTQTSLQDSQEPGSDSLRASDEAKPDISPDQPQQTPPDAPQTISEHGRAVLSQLIQNQEIVNELLADWPRIIAVGNEQRFLLAVARAPKLVMQADSPGGYARKVMRDPLGLDDPGAKKRFDRADALAKCKIESRAARERREQAKAKVTPQQRIDANLAEMDALEFQAPGFLALCRDQSEQSDCRELFEHPDCPSMAFAAAEEIDKVAGRSKAKPKSIDPQILLDSMLNRLAALIDGDVIPEPVTVSEPDPAPEMVDPKPRAAKPPTSSYIPRERFRSTFNAMLTGFRKGHTASAN